MRIIKQILYGAFFVSLIAATGFGTYRVFYRSTACLGANCAAQPLPPALELKSSRVMIFSAGPDNSLLALKVSNPQKDYGAKFAYKLDVFGSFGVRVKTETGSGFVGPGETSALVFPLMPIAQTDLTGASFDVTSLNWLAPKNLPDFKIDATPGGLTTQNGGPALSVKLTNPLSSSLTPFYLSAFLIDSSGKAVSASSRELIGLGANQSSTATLFFPPLDLPLNDLKAEVYVAPAQ